MHFHGLKVENDVNWNLAQLNMKNLQNFDINQTGNFPVGLVLLWGLKKGDFLAPKRGPKIGQKGAPPKSQTKRKITKSNAQKPESFAALRQDVRASS